MRRASAGCGEVEGKGDRDGLAAGIFERSAAVEGLAANVAEGELGWTAGKGQGSDAGEFTDGPGIEFGCERGAGGGQRAFEAESGEGAVDAAAGVNTFDDLLAEVAAFAEMQGAGLRGLLGEIAGGVGVADVGAVAGSAFEDTKGFEGVGVARSSAGCGDCFGEGGDGGGVGPELEAGNDGAVGVDD